MRYLIDEQDTDLETSLALYRSALSWAAPQSDSFILSLDRSIYDDTEDEKRLCALGQITTIAIPESTQSEKKFFQEVVKLFSSLADLLQVHVQNRPTEIIQIRGIPDEVFVKELTRKAAPDRAISGDLCLVEDLELFAGERRLYSLYDYGRTQMLDLTDKELESFLQTLEQVDLDPAYVIPAPPYIINSL